MYWLTGVLGLALFLSPFMLGYSSDHPAFWSNILLGSSIVVVSAIKALAQDRTKWEYWVEGILGLVILISPFVFHYTTVAVALWASILVGAIVTILSGVKIFSNERQVN